MARSRSRSRSKRSPTDWVVTSPSWDSGALNLLPEGSTDVIPLTQQAVQADPLLRAVPQVEQSVVAVRGQLFFFPASPLAANARGVLDLRIIRVSADLAGLPAVVTGYDLNSSTWADEAFLWHRTQLFPAGGTWLEPEKRQVLLTVDVNVKVGRRLEAMEILALAIKWEAYGQVALPDIEYMSRLRCLVKYMSAGG